MPHRTCSVPDCTRPYRCSGYCGMHYARFRKHGEPGEAAVRRRPTDGTCEVDGCVKKIRCKGLCKLHYSRWLTLGETGEAESLLVERDPICTVEGCGLPHAGRGFCGKHYQRAMNGINPSAPSRRERPALRDNQGRKRCSTCREWKELAQFAPVKRTVDGLRGYCRECNIERHRRRKWGMSLSQLLAIVDKQQGCAICHASEPGQIGWVVDHDHACCPGGTSCGKCIRGVLCARCNCMLGFAKDDREVLIEGAAYLERTAAVI